MVGGLGLVAVELFLIPGMGAAGIAGVQQQESSDMTKSCLRCRGET